MTYRDMSEGETKYSYPMVGGDGPLSYSHNSKGPRALIDAAKGLIQEAISTKVDLENPVIRIADFGCSVGPNTFISVQNIIEAIENKLNPEEKQNQNPRDNIEFQVFFNDHLNNDFNTLFKTLPPNRNYFATAVPGSFHDRLLPNRSLHVAHASTTIHWVSRNPKEVIELNKKSIHCTGFIEEVDAAYAAQFKKDVDAFLAARATELVPGGLMLILGLSQPDGVVASETVTGMIMDTLGACLFDMAKMGLLSEEKVESFNLPMYFTQVSELKKVMEANECFSLEVMESFMVPVVDVQMGAQALASMFRAILEVSVKEHFGEEIIGDLFERLEEKLEIHSNELKHANNGVQFLAVLRRKNY